MAEPGSSGASAEERLEQLREYAHNGLRYCATAYTKMGSPKVPDRLEKLSKEWDAHIMLNEMRSLAYVLALVGGAPDARAALGAREGIVLRYLRDVEDDPWTPEEGQRLVRPAE